MSKKNFSFEMRGFRDCNYVKPKSYKVVISCRLDERYSQELKARAEELNTTVHELVEMYVLAGLRESSDQETVTDIQQNAEKPWLN